jgi:hypothetical protein
MFDRGEEWEWSWVVDLNSILCMYGKGYDVLRKFAMFDGKEKRKGRLSQP